MTGLGLEGLIREEVPPAPVLSSRPQAKPWACSDSFPSNLNRTMTQNLAVRAVMAVALGGTLLKGPFYGIMTMAPPA